MDGNWVSRGLHGGATHRACGRGDPACMHVPCEEVAEPLGEEVALPVHARAHAATRALHAELAVAAHERRRHLRAQLAQRLAIRGLGATICAGGVGVNTSGAQRGNWQAVARITINVCASETKSRQGQGSPHRNRTSSPRTLRACAPIAAAPGPTRAPSAAIASHSHHGRAALPNTCITCIASKSNESSKKEAMRVWGVSFGMTQPH
jgi:hypothetical protein